MTCFRFEQLRDFDDGIFDILIVQFEQCVNKIKYGSENVCGKSRLSYRELFLMWIYACFTSIKICRPLSYDNLLKRNWWMLISAREWSTYFPSYVVPSKVNRIDHIPFFVGINKIWLRTYRPYFIFVLPKNILQSYVYAIFKHLYG